MANELTVNLTVQYEDAEGSSEAIQSADVTYTVGTKRFVKLKQAVGTSEEALILGDVSSLGFVAIKNLDATNFVNVKVEAGGTVIAKLRPGGPPLFLPVGSGITAPFVQADTSACQIETLIVST